MRLAVRSNFAIKGVTKQKLYQANFIINNVSKNAGIDLAIGVVKVKAARCVLYLFWWHSVDSLL